VYFREDLPPLELHGPHALCLSHGSTFEVVDVGNISLSGIAVTCD